MLAIYGAQDTDPCIVVLKSIYNRRLLSFFYYSQSFQKRKRKPNWYSTSSATKINCGIIKCHLKCKKVAHNSAARCKLYTNGFKKNTEKRANTWWYPNTRRAQRQHMLGHRMFLFIFIGWIYHSFFDTLWTDYRQFFDTKRLKCWLKSYYMNCETFREILSEIDSTVEGRKEQ